MKYPAIDAQQEKCMCGALCWFKAANILKLNISEGTNRRATTYQLERVSSWTGWNCCEIQQNCKHGHATTQRRHHGWISLDKGANLNWSQTIRDWSANVNNASGKIWIACLTDKGRCPLAVIHHTPDCHKITWREPALHETVVRA